MYRNVLEWDGYKWSKDHVATLNMGDSGVDIERRM